MDCSAYIEAKKAEQDEVGKLPFIFAFSMVDLDEGVKKRVGMSFEEYVGNGGKVVGYGAGAYSVEEDVPEIRKVLSHNVSREFLDTEERAVQAFYYEMLNYEYCINYDGDYEVIHVFFPAVKYDECKNYNDYLAEAGCEKCVNEWFASARKAYFDACEENGWW